MKSHSICEQLADEFLIWFEGLIKKGQKPIKAFTGVRPDMQQFVCIVNDFQMDPSDSLDMISEALHYENCYAFAHSMRMMKIDKGVEIEVLDIFSGQQGEYRLYEFQVLSDSLKLLISRSSPHPEIFLQELPPEHYSPSAKKGELVAAWTAHRSNLMWRTRE